MNLMDLVEHASNDAEDWGEFTILIPNPIGAMHSVLTDDIEVEFDTEKAVMVIRPKK